MGQRSHDHTIVTNLTIITNGFELEASPPLFRELQELSVTPCPLKIALCVTLIWDPLSFYFTGHHLR